MESNTSFTGNTPSASFEETLANLLRSDRLGTLKIPELNSETRNLLWWFLIGRVELARGVVPTVDELHLAFGEMEGWPSYEGLTMNRAMYFLWHARPELQERYNLEDPTGFWDYLAWFYSDGMRQHLLADHVPAKIRFSLNKRADSTMWEYADSEDEQPPLLLVLVLRTRPELKDTFKLDDPYGRLALFTWFFTMGARRLGLYPLISDQWRMWCFTPIMTGPLGFECPRIAFMNWSINQALQQDYPLDNEESHKAFLAWLQNKFATDEEWRWLKVPTREKKLSSLFSTQVQYNPPTEKFGVNLIGFAYGELGIGEDIRMAAAVCEQFNIPYNIVNINPGAVVRQGDLVLEDKIKSQADEVNSAPFPVNIFCLTGFETARIYLQLGPTLFSHRYNVGWWPWELPKWPKRWAPAFELIDEVWGATQFNVDMYRQATVKPVRKVSLTAKVDRLAAKTRGEMGLPEVGFLFLYVFDFNSYLARKNPFAAVAAFQKAFNPHDDSVRLILKTMHAREKDSVWKEFKAQVDADPRIILIDRTMDRSEVLALIKNCDAYLSLHRSEGFGRTLAEAMLLGKPVIASDYSGNADFMFEHYSFKVRGSTIPVRSREYPFIAPDDQAVWFDPDIEDASEQMRKIRKMQYDSKFRKKLIDLAHQQFSAENSTMPQALRSIFLRLQTYETG